MKQNYLEFIKKFSKINVSSICKLHHIDRVNVLHGRASEETTKIIYNELKKQLEELLFLEEK